MPQVQYPFIDVAVHPAVRGRFAAGDAIALFSRDMREVLWANGEGARLFGHAAIYDLIESGPDRSSVSYRQLSAAAAQLVQPGDKRTFMMRISSGFRSAASQADAVLIEIAGQPVVMFATAAGNPGRLSALLEGFDDPDTHMALIDRAGTTQASSAGFASVGLLPETLRGLISAANRSADGLVKRPVPTGAGYVPAAIGRLSDDLFLIFCVETSLGRMDAPEDDAEEAVEATQETGEEPMPQPGELLADQNEAAAVFDGSPDEEPVGETPEDYAELAALDGADAGEMVQSIAAFDENELREQPTELVEDQNLGFGSGMEDDEGPEPSDSVPDDYAELMAMDGADDGQVSDATESDADGATEEVEPAEDKLSSEADDLSGNGELAALVDGEMSSDPNDVANVDAEQAFADAVDAPEGDLTGEQDGDQAAPVEASSISEEGVDEDESESEASDSSIANAIAETDAPAEQALPFMNEGPDQVEVAADAIADDADQSIEDMPEEATVDEAQAEAGNDDPIAEPDVETAAEDQASLIEQPMTAPEAGQDFVFNRGGRPVRFVWKLDAEGRFADVSEEFARAVGPRSGNINDKLFSDLAGRYDLDPDREIAGLLERRDTWSGRTIRWPVEGTDLVVPVDLAALPTYSREREFDGFRGFGIVRLADAEVDPKAIGLAIVAADEPLSHEDVPLTVDGQFDGALVDEETTAELSADEALNEPQDEFRGEVPALNIVTNPLASFSDKIIQLEERRARGRDGLSPAEQAALKEIARQLEPFGKRPNEEMLKSTSGLLQDDGDIGAADEVDSMAAEEEMRALAIEAELEPPLPEMEPVTVDEDFGAFVATESENTVDSSVEGDQGSDDVDAENDADANFEALGDGPGLTADAIDQVPMAILIHAGDRLIHANSEFKRLTGFDSVSALEDAGGLDALIARREGADAGVYLIRADASQLRISARLQSVRFEGSSALMLALTPATGALAAAAEPEIIGDNAAVRQIAALSVEVEELRAILETATDGVIILDTEGNIRSLNRSASGLFNFDDVETRGKPFAMLFAHESQKAVQDYLAGLAGHGVASVLNDGREVIGRESSGGFIPLFMTMGRLPGSNSYCAVIRDITQWKRSEEELRTAKRAAETANQHKSDFLARVSHEIRTPLNAIIGFSDMIASEHFGPAGHTRYVEYASDIGRSGRHVLDIVNDLLDISKIEAGEMDLEFSAVGINDCVSEAVSLVQPQANAQRVIIRTSLSQSVPDVVADLRSIKQIAINILANAIRFTPSGGQIVVSTVYEPSGSVALRIRDTGIGMAKSELEQAMKPFGQVSSGTRQRGDGTGLGLPLTKAMTEANRAYFVIHSAPNEGTLVEIVFPPQRVLAD